MAHFPILKAVSMLALANCDMTERYRVLVGQLQFKPRELFPLLTAQGGSLAFPSMQLIAGSLASETEDMKVA